MTPELFWILGPWRGRLAVAARPRGGDWLEDETRGCWVAGLVIVVSLAEKDEAGELDRVPESSQEALLLLRTIEAALKDGKTVAVHCRHGIGRSGLIAAGMLGVPRLFSSIASSLPLAAG